MNDDPYLDPRTGLLRNKLGIRDAEELRRAERRLTTARAEQGIPRGDFDLKHLQAIHRHLFQDVYDWAGKVRQIEISKGGHQFQFSKYIETGMADVHRRVRKADYFRGAAPDAFARGAAEIIGDVNYVHPFREGNGRTQREYLKQLAERAGYRLDLRRIDADQWMEASKGAHLGHYDTMARVIEGAITGRDRSRNGERRRER